MLICTESLFSQDLDQRCELLQRRFAKVQIDSVGHAHAQGECQPLRLRSRLRGSSDNWNECGRHYCRHSGRGHVDNVTIGLRARRRHRWMGALVACDRLAWLKAQPPDQCIPCPSSYSCRPPRFWPTTGRLCRSWFSVMSLVLCVYLDT